MDGIDDSTKTAKTKQTLKPKDTSTIHQRHGRKLTTAFLILSLIVVATALTFFVLYETGRMRVTKTLSDGSIFSGYWKMGEPFGEGVLVTADGELIEGEWQDGKLNSGVIVAREFTYAGSLRDYLPDGYGSCHYKNGTRYHGFWKNGVKSGLGEIVSPRGRLGFGIWKNGELPPVPGQRFEPGQHVYGIDVSNHQKDIDWEKLCLYADSTGVVDDRLKTSPYLQPVLFAVIKSTEGEDWKADTYDRNYVEAKRCGITRGAYHFLRLSDIDGQINNFIRNTHLEPGDLPPVLDMELSHADMAGNREKAISYARKWLEAMEKHYGVRPILYTYDSFYNDYLKGHGFEKYDFFIARYSPETRPRVPHLELWQFSEKGRAGGIENHVDLDLFMGDYAAFEHYLDTICIPSGYQSPY